MHYFRTNVKYVIGGRRFIGDAIGFTLTQENPVVSVSDDQLRDFKTANKRTLIEGTIVETTEPNVDWETVNAITDEEAVELVKNYAQLKQKLDTVTSYPTALKLLQVANDSDRPTKTVKLIEAKVSELEPEDSFSEDALKTREVQ